MGKVISGITTSLDGYITGPNDGPERGLGEGGERLHYWVFGGPWSYAEEPAFSMTASALTVWFTPSRKADRTPIRRLCNMTSPVCRVPFRTGH